MSNKDRIDHIILSDKDLKFLDEWAAKFVLKEKPFRPFFEEALILPELRMSRELHFNSPQDTNNVYVLKTALYFRHKTDEIVFYEFYRYPADQKIKVISFEKDYKKQTITNLNLYDTSIFEINNRNAHSFVNDFLTPIHSSLMYFMEMYQNEEKFVQSQKARVSKKKKSKSKTSVRSITRTVYTVKINEEDVLPAVKRAYERQKEGWGVRGHWRQYKNGNRVWINPYVKGDTSKKQSSTYKL